MYDIKMLKAKKIAELIEIADQKGLKNLEFKNKNVFGFFMFSVVFEIFKV